MGEEKQKRETEEKKSKLIEEERKKKEEAAKKLEEDKQKQAKEEKEAKLKEEERRKQEEQAKKKEEEEQKRKLKEQEEKKKKEEEQAKKLQEQKQIRETQEKALKLEEERVNKLLEEKQKKEVEMMNLEEKKKQEEKAQKLKAEEQSREVKNQRKKGKQEEIKQDNERKKKQNQAAELSDVKQEKEAKIILKNRTMQNKDKTTKGKGNEHRVDETDSSLKETLLEQEREIPDGKMKANISSKPQNTFEVEQQRKKDSSKNDPHANLTSKGYKASGIDITKQSDQSFSTNQSLMAASDKSRYDYSMESRYSPSIDNSARSGDAHFRDTVEKSMQTSSNLMSMVTGSLVPKQETTRAKPPTGKSDLKPNNESKQSKAKKSEIKTTPPGGV